MFYQWCSYMNAPVYMTVAMIWPWRGVFVIGVPRLTEASTQTASCNLESILAIFNDTWSAACWPMKWCTSKVRYPKYWSIPPRATIWNWKNPCVRAGVFAFVGLYLDLYTAHMVYRLATSFWTDETSSVQLRDGWFTSVVLNDTSTPYPSKTQVDLYKIRN